MCEACLKRLHIFFCLQSVCELCVCVCEQNVKEEYVKKVIFVFFFLACKFLACVCEKCVIIFFFFFFF